MCCRQFITKHCECKILIKRTLLATQLLQCVIVQFILQVGNMMVKDAAVIVAAAQGMINTTRHCHMCLVCGVH